MINVVCALIENTDGEFLICQRAEGKTNVGKWEFPGGKIEQWEGEGDALKREILEELGCKIKVGEALTAVHHQCVDITICLSPYLCTLEEGEPKLLEHASLQWCSEKDFSRFDWTPADVPIWRELVSRKGLHSVGKSLGK